MSTIRCPGQDPMFMKAQDVQEASCPECGQAVEFWPDELVRKCRKCGHRVVNPGNSMKCLEWCRYAPECLAAIREGDDSWIGPLRAELVERMRRTFGSDERRIEHALSVLRLTEEIGRETGADPFVYVPAAALHDIGYAAPEAQKDAARHGAEGRRIAAELLADLNIPRVILEEILGLIEHHHDRGKLNTPNGSPLFDADLIVNLQGRPKAERAARLEPEALTEAGRRVGRANLA